MDISVTRTPVGRHTSARESSGSVVRTGFVTFKRFEEHQESYDVKRTLKSEPGTSELVLCILIATCYPMPMIIDLKVKVQLDAAWLLLLGHFLG